MTDKQIWLTYAAATWNGMVTRLDRGDKINPVLGPQWCKDWADTMLEVTKQRWPDEADEEPTDDANAGEPTGDMEAAFMSMAESILNDDNGIGEAAYESLIGFAEEWVPNCAVQLSSMVDATDGRFYLPSDDKDNCL